MNRPNIEIESVAKFGGTSMAQPDVTAEQLAQPGNAAEVVVVSAPAGLTDALHDLEHTVHPTTGQWDRVQERIVNMAAVCDRPGTNRDIQSVVGDMPSDVSAWQQNGNPITGLGEYWSARIFAAATGRQFVDARDVVRFNGDDRLDPRATLIHARAELGDGGQYVVPGYYGADADGRVRLLDRSGSDISAAILAHTLNASRLDIWSDVPGFMTANPSIISDTRHVPEITQREARAMYPGCVLLHRDVLRFAGRAGMSIYLRNTFGAPDNVGTVVRDRRDHEDMPIVGVVGMTEMSGLNLYQFGSEEQSGSLTDVFETMAGWNIPLEDMATSVDDLFMTFQDEHLGKLPHGVIGRNLGYDSTQLRPANSIRIVGEGLAVSGSARTRLLAASTMALAEAGVDVSGCTGAPDSVSRTFFVEGDQAVVDRGVNVVHAGLFGD